MPCRARFLVPARAIGEDQGGRYLLVVNQDDIVEQRYVKAAEQVGDLRVISSASSRRRPRRHRRPLAGPRRDEGHAETRPTLDAIGSTVADMMSKFFIEHPVLANVLAIVMVLLGAVAALSRCRSPQYPNVVPPTVQVTTRYPGASAADRDRHHRPADRAAGQRRRPHALHAVDQRRRRHLQADGDLRHRLRSEHRSGAGAEPRADRHGLAAAIGADPGRHRPEKNTALLQIVTLDSPTGSTTACS